MAISSNGTAPGSYIVALRGQDADGNWGPFSATFLYVVEPGVSPVIEGYVRAGGTGDPLDAAVRAGVFQAHTDPATGYYSMTVISGSYDMTASAVTSDLLFSHQREDSLFIQ